MRELTANELASISGGDQQAAVDTGTVIVIGRPYDFKQNDLLIEQFFY